MLEAEPQLEAVVAVAGAQDAQVALPAGLLVAAAPRRRPLPGVAVPDSLQLSLQESGLPGRGVEVSPWCQGVKSKTIGELDTNRNLYRIQPRGTVPNRNLYLTSPVAGKGWMFGGFVTQRTVT